MAMRLIDAQAGREAGRDGNEVIDSSAAVTERAQIATV